MSRTFLAAMAGLFAWPATAADPPKPNIVFILAGDLD
jgi:hypothetical protein